MPQKCFRHFIAGENGVVAPSSAPILVMVARSGTVKVLTPSGIFNNLAYPTLYSQEAQDFQDNIFCRDPRRQFASNFTCTTLGMVK